MSSFNERISALITELNLTKAKFAEKIHVTPQFVSMMCSGAKLPSDRTITDICREFNVNEVWLRTGGGDMFLELDTDDEIAAYVGRLLKNENAAQIKKLLLFFSRLSPELLNELEKAAEEILGEKK